MRLVLEKILDTKRHYGVFLMSLLMSYTSISFSQNVPVTGEASVLENDAMKTRLQYEFEATLLAKENAINAVFGTSVLSNYERLTVTEMNGRSVAFNSDVRNNYLNTFPNGIWIEDKSVDCSEEKDEKGNIWLTCRVSGYARKIESARVSFRAFTLDGINPLTNKSESFIEGESGYLYFKSPDSGYIVVFYDDMKTVQRCIPYDASNENCMSVDGNREYVFFSPELNTYLTDKKQVDEIEFYTEMPTDYNQFYVLFSPEPFKGYFLEPSENLDKGRKTFRSMDRDSFHAWLQENRIRNQELQVQIIGVTIKKKN